MTERSEISLTSQSDNNNAIEIGLNSFICLADATLSVIPQFVLESPSSALNATCSLYNIPQSFYIFAPPLHSAHPLNFTLAVHSSRMHLIELSSSSEVYNLYSVKG